MMESQASKYAKDQKSRPNRYYDQSVERKEEGPQSPAVADKSVANPAVEPSSESIGVDGVKVKKKKYARQRAKRVCSVATEK